MLPLLRANTLKLHYLNLCWKKIRIVSLFCPSSTRTSGRCTKTKWLASGPSMKLTWAKTPKTGRNSHLMSNTLSNMYLPFLRHQMVSFLRILPKDSALRFKCLKLAASTASKWWWRTSTQRLTAFWSTLSAKTMRKKSFCSKPFRIFLPLLSKQTGRLSGSNHLTASLRGWLHLQRLRASFSVVLSARSFGSRKEVSCLDSLSRTNWFQEMKACTLTSLVYFTDILQINSQMSESFKLLMKQCRSRWTLLVSLSPLN